MYLRNITTNNSKITSKIKTTSTNKNENKKKKKLTQNNLQNIFENNENYDSNSPYSSQSSQNSFQNSYQNESLDFYLENYKTSKSKIGKLTSIRKIYQLLQAGYDTKIDYFNLPSLGNFWKCFNELNTKQNHNNNHNNNENDTETIFWFLAIAILVLFKNTRSSDSNVLPSYVVTIIDGLTSLEDSCFTINSINTLSNQNTRNSSLSSFSLTSTLNNTNIHTNTNTNTNTNNINNITNNKSSFCNKRKFVSESFKNNTIVSTSTSIIQENNNSSSTSSSTSTSRTTATATTTISHDFSSKRKFSHHSENYHQTSNQTNIESEMMTSNYQVEIKNNREGSVSSMWFEFSKILQLNSSPVCIIQAENLSLLKLFITNRYLNFMISMATLNDDVNLIQNNSNECKDQQQQQQKQLEELLPYWKILNRLKTSGSLSRISLDLCQMIQKLLEVFNQINNNHNNPDFDPDFEISNVIDMIEESENKKLRIKLWLSLGILESACFQCPLNQRYLCEEIPKEIDYSLIDLLTSLIIKLSPYIVHLLTQSEILRKDTTLNTIQVSSPRVSSPFVSPSKRRGYSNRRINQNRDRDKVPSTLLSTLSSWNVLSDIHNLRSDIDNSNQNFNSFFVSYQDEKTKQLLQHQVFQFNIDVNTESSGSSLRKNSFISHSNKNNNRNKNTKVIDFHDIWIAGLKLAINLTPTNLLNNTKNNILESTFKSFIELFSWRTLNCNHSQNINNQSQSIDLPLNKFVFDSLLYLLTLLTNLIETSSSTNKLQLYELILTMLQNAEFPKLKETEFVSNDSINNMFQYLVSSVIIESECFLYDLEVTDETISMKLCKKQAKYQTLSSSSSSSSSSSFVSLSSNSNSNSPTSIHSPHSPILLKSNFNVNICTTPTRNRNNITTKHKKLTKHQFPLEELVISTHIILFLISMLRFLSHYEKDNSNISNKILMIQQLLPRASWWLPKRILMAYLAIQDEMDTIRRNNSLPIVEAIKYLNQLSSEVVSS